MCAIELQTIVLLAKPSDGNLISHEHDIIHAKYLLQLDNNTIRQNSKIQKEIQKSVILGMGLAKSKENDEPQSRTDFLSIFEPADIVEFLQCFFKM